jgi:hypothetical protein
VEFNVLDEFLEEDCTLDVWTQIKNLMRSNVDRDDNIQHATNRARSMVLLFIIRLILVEHIVTLSHPVEFLNWEKVDAHLPLNIHHILTF